MEYLIKFGEWAGFMGFVTFFLFGFIHLCEGSKKVRYYGKISMVGFVLLSIGLLINIMFR